MIHQRIADTKEYHFKEILKETFNTKEYLILILLT